MYALWRLNQSKLFCRSLNVKCQFLCNVSWQYKQWQGLFQETPRPHLKKNTMRRDIVIHYAIAYLLLASIWPTASEARNPEISTEHQRIHQRLTQGVSSIKVGRLCPVIPQREGMYPIVCGGAKTYTGSPLYLQGSCPPVVVAGRFGKGKVVALGHDGWLLERSQDSDTSRLAYNCLRWLIESSRPSNVAFYTSIGTLVTTKTLSDEIEKGLSEQGVTITDLAEKVSRTDLSHYSVLVIARPHTRSISADEAEAICQFVEEGGGLLIAGLGWFWAQCNPTLTIEEFPLNVLGRRLGVKYISDSVWEQSDKGIRLPAKFQTSPLTPWSPKPTKVFKLGETSDRNIRTIVRKYKKTHNFAIEGRHAILNLPADAFLQLHSPTKAIKGLDTVYETHTRLAGNVPYGGKKISFIVVDRLNAHLISGNPVLIRRDRVPVVLKDFNELGHPGWGLTHELGHDFVASAHKHIYQLGPGDNESWANVFTTHAYDTLKLEYDKDDTHWNELRRGIAYYFAKEADYEKLKKDKWIMLSLLMVIKETYGWDPFYRFFKTCAHKAKTGKTPDTEQEKVDFLVRELSVSARVDLSSYFVRWGFPVSKAMVHELRTLPPAELDEKARTMALKYKIHIDDKKL